MRVTPVASPLAIPPQGTPEHVRTAKAVAAFNKGQSSYDKTPAPGPTPAPQEYAVADPNNISPEEMSAVKPHQPDKGVISEQAETETQQEPSQDPQTEEKPKVDPVLSKQFAQLARQEKALRIKQQQQDQALKTREQALAAREAELNGKPQFDSTKYISRDDLKQNTLRQLAEAGITYEELTQQILNTSPTDPRTEAIISKQDARIAQLEAKLEEQVKSQSENQQQAYNAAVKQIEADTKALVQMDPNFETIKATNSVRDVVDLIERVYKKDGILLSVEEAAQEVEDYLVEEAMKISKIGKIKSRLEKAGQPAPVQSRQAQKPQTQPVMKTLTNAASSSRQLSAKERAILAFKGELKS